MNELLDKIKLLSAKDYSFSLGRMYFTRDDCSQNMFVYQEIPNKLELKKDKGIDYDLSCKSKGKYTFTLTPLSITFLNSTKLSRYRTEIKFNISVLIAEQNNPASKIVYLYIVCDLDTWTKNPLNNFTLKNCLFLATNIVKYNVKKSLCIVNIE